MWHGQGKDHPRIRGEKDSPSTSTQSGKGSPPHTRGKVLQNGKFDTLFRITPAYAGKRIPPQPQLKVVKDHPRIRGEKFSRMENSIPYLGSPPHTRGKEVLFDQAKHHKGITPAYAGKSGAYVTADSRL